MMGGGVPRWPRVPGAEAGLCALEGCGGLRRVPERGAGPGEDLEEGRGGWARRREREGREMLELNWERRDG